MFEDAKRLQDAFAQTQHEPGDSLMFGAQRLLGAANLTTNWTVDREDGGPYTDVDHLEAHLASALSGVVLVANAAGLDLGKIAALALAFERGRLADRRQRAADAASAPQGTRQVH